MVRTGQANIQAARETKKIVLQNAINSTPMVDTNGPKKLAILENEIAEGAFERDTPVTIQMTDSEKTAHSNQWRTFRERTAQLEKHRGQIFSPILGQYTQLLQ